MEDAQVDKPLVQNIDDADKALGRINDAQQKINDARSNTKNIVAAAKKQEDSIVQPLEKEIAELRDLLSSFFSRRKKSITAKHGKTITLDNGVVKYRVIPRSLDTPKNVTPIINFLLLMHGGKRYLRKIYELDREVLTQANPKLLSRLNRLFGVWAGKHENISIQTDADVKPVVIAHRRFPKSRHQ